MGRGRGKGERGKVEDFDLLSGAWAGWGRSL